MAKDFRNISEMYLSSTIVKLERQKKKTSDYLIQWIILVSKVAQFSLRLWIAEWHLCKSSKALFSLPSATNQKEENALHKVLDQSTKSLFRFILRIITASLHLLPTFLGLNISAKYSMNSYRGQNNLQIQL